MRRTGLRWLGALLLVAVVAAGCGDSGGEDDAESAERLERAGFPNNCPEASETFDVMNAATYQVFAEAVVAGPDGRPQLRHQPAGTAWAVDDRVMVTNAHVAEIFPDSAAAGMQFTRAIAVQAGTGEVVRLLRGLIHPDYTKAAPLQSPDVALFTTQEELPAALPLAPSDSVLALGDDIQLVGFPGDVDTFITVVPGETVPQATSLSGALTARRSHDDTEAVTTDSLDVYQHQAPTTPGTSGSAMAHCGVVIGVNNAGTIQLVVMPSMQQEGQFIVDRVAAASNNFGVHVRHIHDLLELFRDNAIQGFELPVEATPQQAAAPGGGGGGAPGGGGGGGGGGAPGGGGEGGGTERPAQAATFAVSLPTPEARHDFVFTVESNGAISGTSLWPQTGEFRMTGTAQPDGSFMMQDDAPERLGFRRGIYEGRIAQDGTVTGVYYEQTQEQTQWQFSGRRVQ